jgi:hypothetical protein
MIDADKINLLLRRLRRLKNLSRVSAVRVALDAGFILSEVERLIDAALAIECERRGMA